MAIKHIKCPQCGGIIEADTEKQFAICQNCGKRLRKKTEAEKALSKKANTSKPTIKAPPPAPKKTQSSKDIKNKRLLIICGIFFGIAFIFIIIPSIFGGDNSDADTEKSTSLTDTTVLQTTTRSTTTTSTTTKTTVKATSKFVPAAQNQPNESVRFNSALVFKRNENATVNIIGKPNTEYRIVVYYSSGPSNAEGLVPKRSDSSGAVSWTWHIGGKTDAGIYNLKIIGGGETIESQFYVMD